MFAPGNAPEGYGRDPNQMDEAGTIEHEPVEVRRLYCPPGMSGLDTGSSISPDAQLMNCRVTPCCFGLWTHFVLSVGGDINGTCAGSGPFTLKWSCGRGQFLLGSGMLSDLASGACLLDPHPWTAAVGHRMYSMLPQCASLLTRRMPACHMHGGLDGPCEPGCGSAALLPCTQVTSNKEQTAAQYIKIRRSTCGSDSRGYTPAACSC